MNENKVPTFEEHLDESKVLIKPKDLNKIEDIEFDDIDFKDAPDFVDAYVSSATLHGKELTVDQLDYLKDEYPEWTYDKLQDHLH